MEDTKASLSIVVKYKSRYISFNALSPYHTSYQNQILAPNLNLQDNKVKNFPQPPLIPLQRRHPCGLHTSKIVQPPPTHT